MTKTIVSLFPMVMAIFVMSQPASAAEWRSEWETALQKAKAEGKIVLAIPPSAELRKELEPLLKQKFGIDAELLVSRGADSANRIASEYNAGVRTIDGLIQGTTTAMSLQDNGMLDAVSAYMILPEVKDPKNWWGGHIWNDNLKTKRYIYAFQCYTSETFWYNAGQVEPQEIRSFDDLLNPKWKGRIGFLDPRNPGSGQNTWSFLWKVKGEDYLAKLAQQALLISQNLRQIADALAKGKLAFTVGLSHYSYEPFMKAGLPVKPLPHIKEGSHANNGSGVITVVKNPPHPSAAKVFVSWLLSKEGQELYGKAMVQGTRRLDVNTAWLKESGVEACKDVMTVDDYYRLETHLESSVLKIRNPAIALANRLLR